HVKFLFATTDPHKVITTILSRWQRFDFKKIPPKMIFDKIVDVAKNEKIAIDDKAVLLISRSADGSMRDALVILDQVVSFSDKKITMDDVIELLGMVHKDKIFELSGGVVENDSKGVVRILDALINAGKDPIFITNSLIGHFRDLMILKAVGEPTSDMAFTEEELAGLGEQMGKLSMDEILYILQNLSACLNLMKGTMFSRAPLEITLIRLTKRQNILALPEILSKLEKRGTDAGSFSRGKDPGSFAGNPGQHAVPLRKVTRKTDEERDSVEDPESGDPESTDFKTEKYQWKAILNDVKSKKMSVFMFLKVGRLVEFSNDRVVIGFKKENTFYKEALEVGENMELIEEAVKKVIGGSPKVEFTFPEFWGESAPESSQAEPETNETSEEVKPCIEKAMDVFGGHVVRDLPEDNR
ncbi:MAG: hypothetical protein WBB84_07775, partial [Candidatus Omnitrophota bacterium]